jgi:hypothetical protein
MSKKTKVDRTAEQLGLSVEQMLLHIAMIQPLHFTDPQEVAKSWYRRYRREVIPCVDKFCSLALCRL